MSEPITGPGFFSETVAGRRGQILDAALAVFDEKGFGGGTMREIAERVGFSEPALYRHFAGKEALFTEVVELATERLLSEARTLTAGIDAADLRGSLAVIVTDRRRALMRYLPLARVLLSVAVRREDYRELLGARVVRPLRDTLLEVVPRVDTALGLSFSAEETAARVRAFLSLFVGWMMTSMMLGDDDPSPVVDAILHVMSWDGADG